MSPRVEKEGLKRFPLGRTLKAVITTSANAAGIDHLLKIPIPVFDSGIGIGGLTATLGFSLSVPYPVRQHSRITPPALENPPHGADADGEDPAAWNGSLLASWHVPQELVYGDGIALPGTTPAIPGSNLRGTNQLCAD
jgi:hypothetical protein